MPEAVPTPYDIADIPYCISCDLPTWAVAAALAAALCLLTMLREYLRRKKKRASFIDVRSYIEASDLKREDFALLVKEYKRANPSSTTLVKQCEDLLFQREFNKAQAQKLLQRMYIHGEMLS